MKAVFRREISALMSGITGWLALTVVPFAFALTLALRLLSGTVGDFSGVIADSLIAFAVIVPLYAAQGFSKDKRSGADALLHSLPIAPWQMAAGRFFAMAVPVLVGVAISCLYPVSMAFFARINLVQALTGMVLYAFSAMMFAALGMALSRLSANALVNAVAGIAAFAICLYMPNISSWIVSMGFADWSAMIVIALFALWCGWASTRSLMGALVIGFACEIAALVCLGGNAAGAQSVWRALTSLFSSTRHFASLQNGVLDLGDHLYFLCAAAVLVAITAQGWKMERFAKRRSAQ